MGSLSMQHLEQKDLKATFLLLIPQEDEPSKNIMDLSEFSSISQRQALVCRRNQHFG